ncbi:hypothetical protein ABPG73_002769 [Tetrahymena malaccensis]
MNILNSESSGSNLNISKPSYYQAYLSQEEGLYNREDNASHKFYSSKYQVRLLDQLNDRTYDKINTNFYQDTKMQTIQQLQNQVEKLVEELRTQIHINKDILYENERLQIKYRRLKQMVLEYIQNDETDTERIFNNYNTTLEKLVSQQQKLKDALINSEKKKYIDVNKLYDERTLEEQFQKIKQENSQLKQRLGRTTRNDLNQNQINNQEKSKEDFQKLNKSQNNIKNTPKKQKPRQDQQYQSNNPKGQVLQNLYSFGYRSPHNSSQNSEDQDDLVNYNTKLNKNVSHFPQKQQISDKYINKSSSQNNLKAHKNYH